VTSDGEDPNSNTERDTEDQFINQREEIDILVDDTVPKKNKKTKKLIKSDSSVNIELVDNKDVPVKK